MSTLASVLGVRLLLWLGSTVPTPPDPGVLAGLTRVRVTNDANGRDGFELTFSVGVDKSFDIDLLASGVVDAKTRVWIAAILGVVPEVLIDGVITHHQLQLGNEPGTGTLTVQGTDLTVLLDLEERNKQYPNQPDSVIVTQLLASYPDLGFVPALTPTTDVPIEIQRVPRQTGTDLDFIRKSARRNGFIYYVEPITFGVNTFYWGPPTRAGVPQPALTVNMGGDTNVGRLDFGNDALAAVGAPVTIVEPTTKMRIPLPAAPSLRLPPLSGSPAAALRTTLIRNAANLNPAQALLASAAAATNAPDPVRARGELDTARYGAVLRARRPVGVRGAGRSNDGNWYVGKVEHEIAKDRYVQKFTLTRDGSGALLPVVRP
ncbi:hypothetical protein [Phytohabitans rumicis]|uniref:Uncharacterized protein n=1 Tax=Phytohabitans rumicis TaxID=1076125 RepID=A0A6V8LF14_9ACTN|nr:hypothetical protein [Phytohabitans rumicis]GFJ92666.1 hypothetical protein Prum_063080 [Phytohabitans rumicis]